MLSDFRGPKVNPDGSMTSEAMRSFRSVCANAFGTVDDEGDAAFASQTMSLKEKILANKNMLRSIDWSLQKSFRRN